MTAKKVLEARWISWDSQIILSGPAEPPKSWLGHPFLVDIICPFVWNRVKAPNPNSLLMFLTACSLSRSHFFVFVFLFMFFRHFPISSSDWKYFPFLIGISSYFPIWNTYFPFSNWMPNIFLFLVRILSIFWDIFLLLIGTIFFFFFPFSN